MNGNIYSIQNPYDVGAPKKFKLKILFGALLTRSLWTAVVWKYQKWSFCVLQKVILYILQGEEIMAEFDFRTLLHHKVSVLPGTFKSEIRSKMYIVITFLAGSVHRYSRHIVCTFGLSTVSIKRLQVLSFCPNSQASPVTSLTGSASLALANFHRLPPDRLSRRALFPHRTLILSLLACRRPLSRSPSRTMNAVSAFISYPTCAYYQINARQRDTH